MNTTMFSLRSYVRLLVIAGMAALFFSSCSKIKDSDNTTTDDAAGLMAFNLAGGSSPVQFTLSGNTLTNLPLAYNNYTGTYLRIFPGSREVKAYISTDSSVTASTFSFEPSKYYSLFLVANGGVYENIIVHDDLDSLTGNGKALVRYINAIPDAASPSVTIGSTIHETAAYKNVSSFVPVDPGAVTVSVSNGNTISVNRTITLEAQKIYTILLSGSPSGSGDNAPQIKYILNGTVDDTPGKASSANAGIAN